MKGSKNYEIDYCLKNEKNINKTLTYNINQIITKYILLLRGYLLFISEKLITIKNKENYCFILLRGLDTITSVFTMLLYNTNNLELAYYHSQKSYFYYIEFIEQISDENRSFLMLNSRDASIYVYKKTIFEICNPDIIRDLIKYKQVNLCIDIYKNLIYYAMNADFVFGEKMTYITSFIEDIYKLNLQHITYTYLELCDLYTLCQTVSNSRKNITIGEYVEIIKLFVDKKITNEHSCVKILNEFNEFSEFSELSV